MEDPITDLIFDCDNTLVGMQYDPSDGGFTVVPLKGMPAVLASASLKYRVHLLSYNECAFHYMQTMGVDKYFTSQHCGIAGHKTGCTAKSQITELELKLNIANCLLFDDNETNVMTFSRAGGRAILVENCNLEKAWKDFCCGTYYDDSTTSSFSEDGGTFPITKDGEIDLR
jgi:hypothetical protein